MKRDLAPHEEHEIGVGIRGRMHDGAKHAAKAYLTV